VLSAGAFIVMPRQAGLTVSGFAPRESSQLHDSPGFAPGSGFFAFHNSGENQS